MSTVAPSFILETGDRATIHFPRRRYFLFQPHVQSEHGSEESGSWKFKKIQNRCILQKESRFTRRTSHQSNRHGYLPEVKVPEQMTDRLINNNARSALTEKVGLNHLLAADLI
jgi:hypothetical protein